MFNGMMDPELMRLAQEQMSRMKPEELAKMQQQVLSNPELVRLATESMKNLTSEDVRRAAEQLKHTRPEDMAEVREKLAKAKPEELASMKAQADAQVAYGLSAAKQLKQQGNELHSRGQYHDAASKYLLAKNNLKDIPIGKGRTLQLQCSLNLMSCYLKLGQFHDCINEGSEVLAYDMENVKAFYRRGQAYKEIGNLEAAVDDLKKAHEISPDDETIENVLREVQANLISEKGTYSTRKGLVIEEIVEEENQSCPSNNDIHLPAVENSVTTQAERGETSQRANMIKNAAPTNEELLKKFGEDPESIRFFQNCVSNADPATLEVMGLGGIPPDMIRSTTEMISKMKPEELQGMLKVASSLNGKGEAPKAGSQFPEINPDMVKLASDTISKMSPEDMQEMFKVASSMNMNGSPFPTTTGSFTARSSGDRVVQSSVSTGSSSKESFNSGESSFRDSILNLRTGQTSSSFPTSATDVQEHFRNSMNDPATRQMFTTMMKNMNPEMMASMSEQFGMKMSKEDAARAHEAMSKLSPEDLDKMMRWADKLQRGVDTAKRTKNWLLGRPGMILALVILILAFILHQLGFIGG